MPGDVAMHEPRAGVVGFEADDEEANCGEESHVAAWGVGEAEGGLKEEWVVAAVAFCEDGDVVAVEVEGVCDCLRCYH